MKRAKTALSLIGAVLACQVVLAEVPDAAWKVRTAAGLPAHEAQAYQRSARERAQIIYYYQQAEVKLPKAQLQEHVAAVKRDLSAADKALETLKTQHAKEPDVVKLISSIEAHHKKAHEHCGMAEELCKKEHGDHVGMADCCSEMWHELDAAQAETEKLMKALKIDKLLPPKAKPVK
jgi:uncharacterized protein HemY